MIPAPILPLPINHPVRAGYFAGWMHALEEVERLALLPAGHPVLQELRLRASMIQAVAVCRDAAR